MMSLRFCVIHLTIIHLVCCTPCSISRDGRTADCSHRHLNQIPNLSSHTEYLDLTGNNFTTLRNTSFEHLPNLKTLNLRSCHIDHIDGQVFAVLGNLQKLTMSENRINILHKRFEHLRFHQNPLLTHLNLSYNTKVKLQNTVPSVYPDEVFGSLTSLQVLTMDLLPNPVFGEGFSNLTNITSLMFRECAILHLKNDTFQYFQNLTKLTSLEMSNCQVHILPWVKVETAVLQYFHTLQYLDLSGTMITFPVALDILYGLTVTTNQSHPVRKMKLLNLYNVNPLKLLWMYDVSYTVKLTKEMTKYYKHLCIEDVNIGKNGIVEVDVDSIESFIDNSCLKRFVMRENNFLFTFPKFMFAIVRFLVQAVNLQEIDYSYIAIQFSDVSGNQFPNVVGGVYDRHLANNVFDPETTRHLSLSGRERYRCMLPITSNHLSHVCISHLMFPFSILCDIDVSMLPMLTYLDMSYMTIDDMDFKIIGAKLSYFDVSGMDFGHSGSRLLGNLVGVKRLMIRDANLDRAFSNGNYIFRNASRIDELDMSLNHLNSLPNETLEGLEDLQKLNLSWNFMKKIPPGLFKMNNLSHIDLRYNKLVFLDKVTTDWLDNRADRSESGVTVLLDGNPFTCTCDTEDFVSWIILTKVKLQQREPANFTCTLKDGSISNIKYVYDSRDDVFRNCNDHLFWLQFSISAISLVILAIVCATIGHTFRWRILYFFYRNCKIKPGMEDTTSYSYDLFVAYTAADSPWIWQQLRPTLELQHSIPLCLHERDFEVGESISQNIVNCLQKSKKILFVISPEYIAARWCDFELEMANMERVQRGCTNSIIVAIKGDIPADHMPRPIMNIWQHVTCIIYPLDETDRDAFELFWCRLRHSIVS
ncbi:toll-like receptor 4 [Mizuhopecten yessoensis]|uniref:toll-like receptor 4 n=1 Tax=Mizuhopecten yessoensis TaxID=6573 RepID=UPI000B45B94E|nr:toll-like receptor 4 [Mizuhopecten yessoensis]